MLTLRQGLYKSKNMVSIRILQAIGPQYGQDYLTRFGFDKARQPAVLPLALGAGSVTPLQVAGAYAVFANGGYRITPYLIDRVTDSNGKVIMRPSRSWPATRPAPSIRAPPGSWTTSCAAWPPTAPPRARVLLAMTSPARPAPPTNRWTPGSRATRPRWWRPRGWASTSPSRWLARDRRRRRHADLGGLHADRAQGRAEEKPRPARTASSSRTANTISRNSRRDRRWPAWACRKPTRWASSSTAWAAAARTTASRWRRASAPGQRPWSQKIPF